MVGAEALLLTSPQASTLPPEVIRQRQRGRVSPRGRPSKKHRIATAVGELRNAPSTTIRLSPPPRAKGGGQRSPDMSARPTMRGDARQENTVQSRARGMSDGEVKVDVTPDACPAGREGRQFIVANVGNNGRIYLR